jgi:hypothetical protein
MPLSTKQSANLVAAALAAILLLGALYSAYWFWAADKAAALYTDFIAKNSVTPDVISQPEITGFPFKMKLASRAEFLQLEGGTLKFEDLSLSAFPVPHAAATVSAKNLIIHGANSPLNISFNSFDGVISYKPDTVIFEKAELMKDSLKISVTGYMLPETKPPQMDLMVGLENYTPFLAELTQGGWIKPQTAMLISAGLGAFRDETGKVNVPVTTQKSGHIFAGPIPLGRLR